MMVQARRLVALIALAVFGCEAANVMPWYDQLERDIGARAFGGADRQTLRSAAEKGEDAELYARAVAQSEREVQAWKDFIGANFGFGPAISIDIGGDERVEKASVVNGVVRVSEENEARPTVLLEAHYFLTPKARLFNLVEPGMWGVGPFVGIQSSTEDVIDSFALGVMTGLRYSKDSDNSFNLGVGAILDPDAKVLGDDIRDGRPLPAGETEVRTKEEEKWGLVVVVSFGF